MVTKKLFIFLIALFCSITLVAQNNTITYSATNKSVVQILQDIEKISHYRFSYNSDIFKTKPYITVSFSEMPINTCIATILGENYSYTVQGNQIIITEKKATIPTIKKTQPKQERAVTVYDTIPVYEHIKVVDTIYENVRVIDTLQHIETIILKRYETNFMHTEKKCLSYSGRTGIQVNSAHFFKNNNYTEKLRKINNNAVGFNIQLDMNYKRNNLLLSSGVGFRDYRVENSFYTKSYIDDPTIKYTDTLWYWQYAEVFTYYKFNEKGDSVAVTVLDSTYTYTLRENPKKIEQQTNKISSLTWQYITIPIGLGFHYNLSNTFAIEPKLACNALLLVHCSGEIVNEAMTNTQPLADIVKRFTYSVSLSCDILYSIEKQYSITLHPFYTITPSILKHSKANMQGLLSSVGFEWGFCYTIPYALF
ncbi:MAG: STN domain-containing protein [Bacteroidales bacterium]|nr:STN domain-containing protein [Bacteroidales bacterium]